MSTIAAHDAKETLAWLVQEDEAGEEVVITNRPGHDIARAREAIRRLRDMAQNVTEPKITTDEILEWIREGRQG